MAKNKYILQKNKKYYEGCNNGNEICPLVEELEGNHDRRIPLFIQFAYSLIALVILGNNKAEGKEWFISLFLFSSPLFLEYFPYKSKYKIFNFIFTIQKFCFGITSIFGFIGVLTDVITIKLHESVSYIQFSQTFFMFRGREFNINWILYPLLVCILFIFTHIFGLTSKKEEIAASQMEAA